MASKLEKFADEMIESQLEELDDQIEKLNEKLRVYDAVKDKRDRLVAARRVLLGGSMTGGAGGNRITRDEVVRFMEEHDPDTEGLSVAEIAEGMNTTDAVIRGHLSRGNNERFTKRGNKWILRDPERIDD